MALLKLCLHCGRMYQPCSRNNRGRCRDCLRKYEREKRQRRGSTTQRGYDSAWRELASRAIQLHPYCANCSTTTDLTVDHIDPKSKGRKDLTIRDVQVLCRSCNGSKGGRGSRSIVPDRQTTPALGIRERNSKNAIAKPKNEMGPLVG